jgi:outer membrane receptor protein involved in Fe transport
MKKGFILIGLLMLVAVSAFAQTTANISGTVTTDGAPLPGATVTITSPQMIGTRTTVTGDAGGYSFAGVPPGTYTVKVELEGMQSATKTVSVGVGQSGRADADLKVAAVTEAITVTAAAPTVLETPSVSTNVTGDLVDELPIARTVLAAALLAPGVNDNTSSASQLSISGSPGYDNLVMVNGVAITENVRHQALNLFIEDAVQETTVLTGAISAEYGGFTGGVVNSITKSGGNEFSGSFRDSLTNPSWQERTPGQRAANASLLDKLGSVYEGTLGGYVMKDRIWFFGSGRKTKSDQERSLRAVPLGDATRASLPFVTSTDETRYEIKLTGQVTSRHNLAGSYFKSDSTQTGAVFTTTSYDLEQLSGRKDPQELKTIFYNGVITNNFLVEARYNAMEWGVANGNGSQFTDFVRGTIVRNLADGSARWNSPTFCGVCDKETRSNDGLSLKTHYFLSGKGIGNHDFVAGIEKFSEHRFANNYQSGSNFRFFVNSAQRINGVIYPKVLPPGFVDPGTTAPVSAGSAAFLVWTPIFTLQQNESDLASDGLFINDRWDFNSNWSFNLGLRYDKNDATDGTGNKVSDDSRITPRLSATWDPLGNGRHRITASYSQYASKIVDGPSTAASSGGSPGYIYYAYRGPAINPAGTPTDQLVDTRTALAQVQAWFESQCSNPGPSNPLCTNNLSLLRPNSGHSVPGFDTRIDAGLESPYVEELTLGYGTQWRSNIVTRVDVVSRNWKSFYAFRVDQSTPTQTDLLGIPHDVAIVENTDAIKREYRGVQFQGAWTPRRFNVGLNYTYSTLKGNDEQESATSGTVGNTPGSIFYPELNDYAQRLPEGYLAQDERHRARAWVGYDVPWPHVLGALNVSVLQQYDSGLPYSAIGVINTASFGIPAKYQTASGTRNYYFSERGAFRLPDVTSTNLALNYRLPIHGFELYGTAEMLNVFNNDEVTTVVTTVNTNRNTANLLLFNPFTDAPKECPQGTALADCRAMGANWQKAATFGTPSSTTSYQTPRTWRFQVGFRF